MKAKLTQSRIPSFLTQPQSPRGYILVGKAVPEGTRPLTGELKNSGPWFKTPMSPNLGPNQHMGLLALLDKAAQGGTESEKCTHYL